MHRWIEELRRRRFFKQNWFIRPSKGRRRGGQNELGITCTFNYCCQGVCFALLGKANHRLYHPLKKKKKKKKTWRICNIKFTILSVVQHSPQLQRSSKKNSRRVSSAIMLAAWLINRAEWGHRSEGALLTSCVHLRDGGGQRHNMCLSVWSPYTRCAAHAGCWHVMAFFFFFIFLHRQHCWPSPLCFALLLL